MRTLEGKLPAATAGIIDAQSVKTTESGGSYDAGKKVKGRKRHVVVDTLLLVMQVHPANIQDRDGAPAVIAALRQAMCEQDLGGRRLWGSEVGQDTRRLPFRLEVSWGVVHSSGPCARLTPAEWFPKSFGHRLEESFSHGRLAGTC